MNDDRRLIEALRETLLHIAGVSGAAAKRLRPAQALVVDLGLDSVDLAVLADCQRRLGDRLRRTPGGTRIGADELLDLTVLEVCTLTLQRAIGRRLDAAEASRLFAQALAELRGTAT